MKKMLSTMLLAAASLAVMAGSAAAGHTFGLFVGWRGCAKCGGLITLRQYNAFSPAACGNMTFQGCVVAPPAGYANPGFGYGGDCGDGSCAAAGAPYGAFAGMPMPNMGYNTAMSYPGAFSNTAPMMQMPAMPAQAMPSGPIYNTQPTSARMP